MIKSILLEFLADGAIPVYETNATTNYHILEFGDPLDLYVAEGRWRPHTHPHRMVVPLNIDTDNAAVFTNAPVWVNRAQYFPGEGSLIFVIRTMATFDNGETLVLAGMAYSEAPIIGAVPLDETNPADLIIQLLHNNREHPIVRRALEQRDADNREARRYQIMGEEIRRKEARKEKRAKRRAERLLDQHLTHKQRRTLKRGNYFEVRGQDGKTYRITNHSHQNVFLVEGGKRIQQYCAVASERMPTADLLLAQKLLIENNTAHFLAVANKWDLTGYPEGTRGRVLAQGPEDLAQVILEGNDRVLEFRELLDNAQREHQLRERIVPVGPIFQLREVQPMPELPELPELGVAV